MQRNTLFWDSRLPVHGVVVLAKLAFKFDAVLIVMSLVCLEELGEIISEFIGNKVRMCKLLRTLRIRSILWRCLLF